MEKAAFDQSWKLYSLFKRIVLISVMWALLDIVVVPFAIATTANLTGINADNDQIAPFFTWFQIIIFAPFLFCGAVASLLAIIARDRRPFATFYASSVARIFSRWSVFLLSGVVATGLLTALFPQLSEPTIPFSPIVEFPIAFALVFVVIFPKSIRERDGVCDGASQERWTRRMNAVDKLCRRLDRTTSKRIWFVLLGYLIVNVGVFVLARTLEGVVRIGGFFVVYGGWIFITAAFLTLCIVSAIRASSRRRAPRAILYRAASWVYLCCFLAAAGPVPLFLTLLAPMV